MSALRIATVSDLDRIVELERVSFRAGEGGFSRRQLRALLRSPNAFWLIGAHVDAAACWLKVSNGRSRWARLYTLAVHPRLRGQGWAQRLLKAGFAWMKENGLSVCRAEVKYDNHAARRLYASIGFREISLLHNYYGAGRHGVRLVKKPDPS